MKLVCVDRKLLAEQKYVARYAVLRDKSVEEIQAFAIRNPNCFVFTFATKTVEECHDYTDLNGLGAYDHVVQPLYIGNFKKEYQDRIIAEVVLRGLHGATELEEVV